MQKLTPLVLNWHITEACNYGCQYCYATWTKANFRRDLIKDTEKTTMLLNELYQFFQPDNLNNPLTNHLRWPSVRLNFAGGEPLLHADRLISVVVQARAIGFEVSLISNASHMNKERLDKIAPYLSWLGISIYSINPEINREIGRIDNRGELLNLEKLAENLVLARQSHPNLRIKLNTVVNQRNHGEDLSSLIQRFSPEKWKILRMLPVVNKKLMITDKQFSDFVARHKQFSDIFCPEDNQDMQESYLMIDPYGRFFQNSSTAPRGDYIYSESILEAGAAIAFSQVSFDHARFNARYTSVI